MRTGTSFMLALHAAVLLAACGGADPLDKDQVVGIPAGTARGTAASGTYAAHLQVTACSGTCTPRVCEVGSQLDADAAVTQVDGRLTFDAGGVPLAGGIDADGGFVVGGWGALGALEASIRSEGSWTGDGLTGSYDLRVVGTDAGQAIDCVGESALVATRLR